MSASDSIRSTLLRTKLLVTMVTAGCALSVTSGAAAADTGSSADSGGLEEIVITAQRREESLQHAAVAVDVVTSAQLAQSGITSAMQLNQLVPSLTVQQGGGPNTSYFVRGVGNFTQNGISDPALAFNLDGVYLGRPTSSTGTFYDLQRIEVLKGPQGTLYGRNATAGAINVIPNKPVLGETSANVALSYGNYSAENAEGAVNLAVGTTAALRIAANYVDRNGYNDDGTMDENGRAVRAQFLVQPTEAFSVRLAWDFARQGGTGTGPHLDGEYVPSFGPPSGGSPFPTVTNTFVPSNLPVNLGLLSPQTQALFGTYLIGGANINPAPVTRPYQDNTYDGALAEIGWKTAAGDLTIIPATRRGLLHFNFNGPSFQSGLIDEDNVQRSLEIRFQGKRAGIFDWLVGGYYFHEDVSGKESYNQYVVNALLDFESKTQSTALFGRLVANLSDDVRLVFGDRYTRDAKNLDGSAPTIVQSCGGFPPAAPFTAPFVPCFGSPSLPVVQTFGQAVANGSIAPTPFTPKPFGPNPNAFTFWIPLTETSSPVFTKDTYRLAAEWDVAPASLLYASYETGYRSGGFSLAVGHDVFQPETLNAYTVGSKNRFLADRLQLNVEAFYWKYNNQQVSHFGADATGNQAYFTENIGKSTIKGIDVDGEYLLAEHTLATFTAQYLNAIINQFTFTQLESGGGAVTGCANTRIQDPQVGLEYVINCAGKPDYFSPKWSLNLGLQQVIPSGAVNVVVAADTAYTSQQYNGFDFLPEQINAAHWTSNASVAVKQPSDRWSVSAYVRNIEGNRYKTSTQFSPASGSVVDSWYSAPRTYGVRLALRF